MNKDNTNKNQDNQKNEIDLLELAYKLWAKRKFIGLVTGIFFALGVIYAVIATPIYQANAILQVETKQGGMPGLGEMGEMFSSESEAVTEIELIKSRMVLGKVVDSLNLDVSITPKYFPIIGKYIARTFKGLESQVREPIIDGYAWGGEKLTLNQLNLPQSMINQKFTLIAGEKGAYTLNISGKEIQGKVGELLNQDGVKIFLSELTANIGTEFVLRKQRRLGVIEKYQRELRVSEKGKQTGILKLTLNSSDPVEASKILNEITRLYVLQNVDRNSAEAAKSLEFLKSQLPQVKQELDSASTNLNLYQVKSQSVNINAESQSILDQVVDIETQISKLSLEKAEVERRFTTSHPTFQALEKQLSNLYGRRGSYQAKIKGLPKTQQELLKLKRDVDVANEIYLQMLNNIQELKIVKAGTVGNVRLVDEAAVNIERPVKPKKLMIVILAILLGFGSSVAHVLVKAALNQGVVNPEQIEEIGLPVYASIPLSISQQDIETKHGRKFNQNIEESSQLLAVSNPADLAIESLRSLRTALHFAMLEAKNNIILISGPSPSVGKSFISTNLAATIAQSGQKVVLIDSDMRKGYIHKMFGIKAHEGLSDYLAGQTDYSNMFLDTGVENFSVIPHGTVPPNPSELLMTVQFETLLKQLSEEYDMVLIDSPPILAVTDPAVIGKYCGTTLMVTRFNLNPIKEIEIAARRFEQNGIDVKGVIFNAVEKTATGYGSYGYYNYEYQSEVKDKAKL